MEIGLMIVDNRRLTFKIHDGIRDKGKTQWRYKVGEMPKKMKEKNQA